VRGGPGRGNGSTKMCVPKTCVFSASTPATTMSAITAGIDVHKRVLMVVVGAMSGAGLEQPGAPGQEGGFQGREAIGAPSCGRRTDAELCPGCRAAAVADCDAAAHATDAPAGPDSESTGELAGRNPDQALQRRHRPARHERTAYPDGLGPGRNRSGGTGRCSDGLGQRDSPAATATALGAVEADRRSNGGTLLAGGRRHAPT
jgi:hypothetical protein